MELFFLFGKVSGLRLGFEKYNIITLPLSLDKQRCFQYLIDYTGFLIPYESMKGLFAAHSIYVGSLLEGRPSIHRQRDVSVGLFEKWKMGVTWGKVVCLVRFTLHYRLAS